jgi:hypothetical protein
MIHKSDSDTTVRRFDLSQQFTAMQRISVVLSRATEASKTLQEVLSVLHNDAFMQHGMICLYDSQQEILSIEALQQTESQTLPGSTQIRYRPGKAWLVPCWRRASRWYYRAWPTISGFSTVSVCTITCRLLPYRSWAPIPGLSAYWRRNRWLVRKSGYRPVPGFSKLSPI